MLEGDVSNAEELKIIVSDYGDGFAYDRADLINPVLIDEDGVETSLTTLTATSYTSSWSNLHINTNVENGTLKVDGQSYTTGLGMNAQCTLLYNLPVGHKYKTFRALCGYDSSCDTDNPNTTGTTMVFYVYAKKSESYSFDLTDLGYGSSESVPVYDIWGKESLGNATGEIVASIPEHGVKLYRLGDGVAEGISPVRSDPRVSAGTSSHKLNDSKAIYDLSGRKRKKVGSGIFIQGGTTIFSRPSAF